MLDTLDTHLLNAAGAEATYTEALEIGGEAAVPAEQVVRGLR